MEQTREKSWCKGPRDTQFDEAPRQLGEGLRSRQLATGIQRAICLSVLTYGSPIWFKQQNQLLKILQDVQDEAVRWMLGAFRTTPHEPLHKLIAILPVYIRFQLLSKTAALTLLTIPNGSQLIRRPGVSWCNISKMTSLTPSTLHGSVRLDRVIHGSDGTPSSHLGLSLANSTTSVFIRTLS